MHLGWGVKESDGVKVNGSEHGVKAKGKHENLKHENLKSANRMNHEESTSASPEESSSAVACESEWKSYCSRWRRKFWK